MADEPISKRLRRGNGTSAAGTSESRPVQKPKTLQKSRAAQTANNTESFTSLLQLTDACLEKVFVHLNVEDLCTMANVCKRFRKIAEKEFSENRKKFKFEGSGCKNAVFRRVLSKFGKLIRAIDASDAYFDGDEQIDVDAIVKCRPPNLEELCLNRAAINCDAVQPLFTRLKHLDLDGCNFTGNKDSLFEKCKNLVTLGFDPCDSCFFIVRNYPKLEGLSFDTNYPGFFEFFKLIALNPQLKWLCILAMAEDIYISSCVKYTKNLERLSIRPGRMCSTPETQTRKVFLQLSQLKKLKKLAIDAGYETYAKLVGPLMDAFLKQKVAINQLELNDFTINTNDIKSIANLKTLEIITLDQVGKISSADLIALTTKLPVLNTLHLYFRYNIETPISVDTLAKMIKGGTKLEYLGLVGVRNINIKQKEFEMLAKAAQSRAEAKKITIQIIGCKSTTHFEVPQSIQQTNMKQLKIVYDDDQGNCECDNCAEE